MADDRGATRGAAQTVAHLPARCAAGRTSLCCAKALGSGRRKARAQRRCGSRPDRSIELIDIPKHAILCSQRLLVAVRHDEAGGAFLDRPGRREAAG